MCKRLGSPPKPLQVINRTQAHTHTHTHTHTPVRDSQQKRLRIENEVHLRPPPPPRRRRRRDRRRDPCPTLSAAAAAFPAAAAATAVRLVSVGGIGDGASETLSPCEVEGAVFPRLFLFRRRAKAYMGSEARGGEGGTERRETIRRIGEGEHEGFGVSMRGVGEEKRKGIGVSAGHWSECMWKAGNMGGGGSWEGVEGGISVSSDMFLQRKGGRAGTSKKNLLSGVHTDA